jgi:hypothetical protein
MLSKLRRYRYFESVVNESKWFEVERYCNGFTVTNIGTDTVTVNNQIYFPGVPGVSLGDSRSFGGNENEIYVGRISVSFAGLAAIQQIEVVQKVFILTEEEKDAETL